MPAARSAFSRPQRGRLRRKSDPLQPDRLRAPCLAYGEARQDLPDPRRGLLLPPRPSPDVDARPHRSEEGRVDHRDALPDGARRRRIRVVRRGVHLLHGGAPDRDVPNSRLPVRRRARVHEQAAVRAEARSRHAAAAIRARSAAHKIAATSGWTQPTCGRSSSSPPTP